MIDKIRSLLPSNKAAWISCMAATTITAGAIAFAAVTGPAEDIDIAVVETDTINTEVTAETTRSASHDREFFTDEELRAMTEKVTEVPAVEETEEVTERETERQEEVTEAPVYEAQTELPETEPETEIYEDEADETEYETEAAETETAQTEEPEYTEAIIPAAEGTSEPEKDSRNAEASGYNAGGEADSEDSELSSALDLDFSDTEEVTAAEGFDDPYFIMMQSKKDSRSSKKAAKKAEAAKTEPAETEPASRSLFHKDSAEGVTPETVDHISMLDIPSWLTLDENGIPKDYIKVHTGNACAYTADPDALMSTGKAVFQGYVAVNPDIIPYGSQLYIVAEDGEVYGYAIAADTGGSVRRGAIIVDLFMNEYDDCIQWGNKPVKVYVLSE